MEIRPRRKGMTLALVLEMKEKLEKLETIGVASKEYPLNIVNMLNKEGVKFKVEEIKPMSRFEPIFSSNGFEEYISGYREINSGISTYIFSSVLAKHVKP